MLVAAMIPEPTRVAASGQSRNNQPARQDREHDVREGVRRQSGDLRMAVGQDHDRCPSAANEPVMAMSDQSIASGSCQRSGHAAIAAVATSAPTRFV